MMLDITSAPTTSACLRHARAHESRRRRQRVGEAGAGGAEVEAPRPGRADLVLQQARGAREHRVRRRRADDDHVDVGRLRGPPARWPRARPPRPGPTWPRPDRRCGACGCRSAAGSTRRWCRPSSRGRRWSACGAAGTSASPLMQGWIVVRPPLRTPCGRGRRLRYHRRLSFPGSSSPKKAYARRVTMRPRGVRSRKPTCIRKGS